MTIPVNAKNMILFVFDRRGIEPAYVDDNTIAFHSRYASGLEFSPTITILTRKTILRWRPILVLGIVTQTDPVASTYRDYNELPKANDDLPFGIQCASKLLVLAAKAALAANAGDCLTPGWNTNDS